MHRNRALYPSKSLLENLRDFQAAMEAEAAPEIQETEVEGEYLLTYGGMEKRFTAAHLPAEQLPVLNRVVRIAPKLDCVVTWHPKSTFGNGHLLHAGGGQVEIGSVGYEL